MTNVEIVFQEYRLAAERGEAPDPRIYLERVEGRDRVVLELMIEHHRLAGAQAPREFDAAAFESAREESWLRAAGTAPDAMPLAGARERAGLSLRQLAARVLAVAGVAEAEGAQQEKAELYLLRLERGELEPQVLAVRAREALRAVLGVELAPGPRPAASFRGAGEPGDEATERAAEQIDLLARALELPAPGRRDEVDELFLGG
ncbi:MAG: hypothetical protein LT070_11555 [Solirubrobacteraceae bacterium]|nr:hypothetical protein [Solirubrobacteraceae bacterium]